MKIQKMKNLLQKKWNLKLLLTSILSKNEVVLGISMGLLISMVTIMIVRMPKEISNLEIHWSATEVEINTDRTHSIDFPKEETHEIEL